jgi:membrane-bound metal-dependent hydrolase YbcI (DUF457 family)
MSGAPHSETYRDLVLGRSHVIVSATGYLAVAASLPAIAGTHPLTPAQIGATVAVAGGAGLIPDLDLRGSSISRALPPISMGLSYCLSRLCGGHRQGSHGLLFAAVLGVALSLGLASSSSRFVAAGLALLCCALVLRCLTEARGLVCAGLAALPALAVSAVAPAQALVVAVVVGVLFHDLADALTQEGVPPLYPFSKKRLRLPLVRTGDWRETAVAGLAGLVALYLLGVTVLWPVFSLAAHPPVANATVTGLHFLPATHTVTRVQHAAPAEVRRLRAEVRSLHARLAHARKTTP